MELYALGVNHNTAPVSVRGQFAFDPARLPQALQELMQNAPVSEAAILSTCNRTELYCTTAEPEAASEWLAQYHALSEREAHPYLYTHPQRKAIRHMFRVASGLDSMVLGEAQILGQMKQAARVAEEAGTLGPMLNQLFQRTFAVAKEVRSSTAIGTKIVSVAAAVIHLSAKVFSNLSERRVLFVGAGEMIERCVSHFASQKPCRITIANRTYARAQALAAQYGGDAIPLEALETKLADYDIIIACTASPQPLIGLEHVKQAQIRRGQRPQVMIDLAVPHDIEPAIGRQKGIHLYTLDDLAHIVDSGLETRQAAVLEAEAIIDTSVSNFLHWVDAREVVPTIRALRENAEDARRREMDHALKLLARGEDPTQVLELLSHGLTNKLIHAPTHALRQALSEERNDIAQLIERIYLLNSAK